MLVIYLLSSSAINYILNVGTGADEAEERGQGKTGARRKKRGKRRERSRKGGGSDTGSLLNTGENVEWVH